AAAVTFAFDPSDLVAVHDEAQRARAVVDRDAARLKACLQAGVKRLARFLLRLVDVVRRTELLRLVLRARVRALDDGIAALGRTGKIGERDARELHGPELRVEAPHETF